MKAGSSMTMQKMTYIKRSRNPPHGTFPGPESRMNVYTVNNEALLLNKHMQGVNSYEFIPWLYE